MSDPSIHRDTRADIAASFGEAGFPVFSVIGRTTLAEAAGSADPGAAERYGLRESAGAVVVAFPYDPRPPGQTGQASLSIGAFAAANRYATMTRLLLAAGRSLASRSGLPAKGFKAIVNSRLPEKTLGALAGLGFIGRSSLLVTRAYGPACLLGALLLPPGYRLGDDVGMKSGAVDTGEGCGDCRACADACPTGAIHRGKWGVDLERCIQHWTTTPGDVPGSVRAAWGARLYGCDECVAACPRSAATWTGLDGGPSPAGRADALALPEELRPGRSVPAAFVESANDAQLRAFFRKTALGMSWIRPGELRRNASISAEFMGYGNPV